MDEEDFHLTPTTKLKRAKFKSRMKSKIMEEILNSEESYSKNLKLLTQFFLDPILQNSILNSKETKIIFGEIPSILRMNQELLIQFKQNTDISTAFLKLSPYFKLYSTYSLNYESANIFLQNLMKSRPKFAEFINCQQTRPEVQTSLPSLLIQPIQRMPRYKLLLQELLKMHDCDDIRNALMQIETITQEMNNQLHVGDKIRRMLDIQKMLVNDQPKIIVPGRHLVKEGSLQKISNKTGRVFTRQFFLFNDMLMYCKEQKMFANGRFWLCRCVLPIRHCRVSPKGGDGNRQRFYFKVNCFDVELNLFSENYNNAKLWMDAISSTSMEFIENRKTLRKTSTVYTPAEFIKHRTPRNRRLLGVMTLSPAQPLPLQHSLACPSIRLC